MIALDLDGKRNITYGDSNLKGTPYVLEADRWSALIANERNGIDVNYGVPGQGWLNPGLEFDETDITTFDAVNNKYLWLANGTNDIGVTDGGGLINGAPFKARLLEIVEFAWNSRWWDYNKIILPTINVRLDANNKPIQMAEFNAVIEEVAEEKNCIFIDVFSHFNALADIEDYFEADGVHLNTLGHRELADFYEAADYTPYNGFPILQIPSLQFVIAE